MNLHEAQRMALELMRKHLPIRDDPHGKPGWYFEWSKRQANYGDCFYEKKRIRLSRSLTAACEASEVKETILHEIAHALVGGGHGHDKVWQVTALEIGCRRARAANEWPPCASQQVPWKHCLAHMTLGSIYELRFKAPRGRLVRNVHLLYVRDRPGTSGNLQWFTREEYLKRWPNIAPLHENPVL